MYVGLYRYSTSDEVVPGLLFADDTCLLASDESGLRKSLDVLIEWCRVGSSNQCGQVWSYACPK